MKGIGVRALAGLLALGCKQAVSSQAPPALPFQWQVTSMTPGSGAASPALLACEANGTNCTPLQPGARVSGDKLVRAERGVSELELDAATHVELAEGSELLLSDATRTLELRVGGMALARTTMPPSAGPLHVKLLDRALEPIERASFMALIENASRATVFVTRGEVKWSEPTGSRALSAGQGALLERQNQADLHAMFSGKVSRSRRTILGAAEPTKAPQSPPELRGLGTMTARVPGASAVADGVRLTQHHVRAVVRDGVAQTEVEEVFQNDGNRVLEGRYVFPLPADATITGLTLFVNDSPLDAEVVEKRRAAAIFKNIVDDLIEPRDPALLEWLGGSSFSLKVFPIPAKGSRKIILRYQQSLSSDGPSQTYVYPLSFGAERSTPIDELSIDVDLSDGEQAAKDVLASGYPATVTVTPKLAHVSVRATASAPDHDFAVSYRRAALAEAVASGERGFVAMRLRAELPADMPPPAFQELDRVLVLDASQSQSAQSFAAIQRLAVGILRSLEPREQFALLLCDSACEAFPRAGLSPSAPDALDDAEAFIAKRKPFGSSDLAGALRAAGKRVTPGAPVQVVYLGDGAPSSGELSVPAIVDYVRPSFEQRKVDLRLFGIGPSVDGMTLAALARELSGSYDQISSTDSLVARSEELIPGLRAPLLIAPTLEVPNKVTELEPRALPNLRLGEEFTVIGKYDAELPRNVTLKGSLNGQPYSLQRSLWLHSPSDALPFAARSWAENRIRELSTSDDPDARLEVIALSKRFRVMSRETSWLVLENDQMYEEFGIPRPRPVAARARRDAPTAVAPADPLRAGSNGGNLAEISAAGRDWDRGVKVAGPKGNAAVGGLSFSGGTIGNAARVLAGMRASFRACYQRGLEENPQSVGKLWLTLKVDAQGKLKDVTARADGNLSNPVVNCIQLRALRAEFDAPEGGATAIEVPITFVSDLNPAEAVPSEPSRHFDTPRDKAVIRPGDESWSKQGAAALDELRAALTATPNSRKRHEALVRGLLLRGRFGPALQAAERYAELDPDSASAHELLAYAALASGDRARATAALDALTESAAADSKAHSRAARAFEALGDEVRACAHWRAIFELARNSDAARFETLRCRARVLDDRDAALREAKALSDRGAQLERLLPLLESGQVPAFEQSSGSAGQFETRLSCELPADCPYAIVITPTGTVLSAWTPAPERSSTTAFAFSGLLSGAYRVLLIGGSANATGQVEVRALNAQKAFSFGAGHATTIAVAEVSML